MGSTRDAGCSVTPLTIFTQKCLSPVAERSRRRGCGSGCPSYGLQASGPIQGTIPDVHMADGDCVQLCTDAFTPATPHAGFFGRSDRDRSRISLVGAIALAKTQP